MMKRLLTAVLLLGCMVTLVGGTLDTVEATSSRLLKIASI